QMLEMVLPAAVTQQGVKKEEPAAPAAPAARAKKGEGNPECGSPEDEPGDGCQVVPPAPATAPATPKVGGQLPTAGSAGTVEQSRKAIEVAKRAAELGVPSLPRRAVGDSLRPGPPVEVPRTNEAVVASARPSITTNDNSGTFATVESTLGELDPVWRRQKLPAADVYETLAGVVLPQTRPSDIFISPPNLTNPDLPP